MAKPKNPLLSFDADGRVGRAIAFARRGAQNIVVRRGGHADAQTPAQQEWRTMWQLAATLWHLLSAHEQRTWEAAGSIRHMTGYAYYMSQALRPNPGIYLPLAGGTMSGDIDTDSNRVTGLTDPTQVHHAARKGYVDDQIAGAALGQGARARRTANQSIAPGGAYKDVVFQIADFDNDGMWDIGNPERLTIKTAGVYLITAQIQWDANVTGYRGMVIQHNIDSSLAQWHGAPNNTTALWRGGFSTLWDCHVNEWVKVVVYQNSGLNIDLMAAGRQAPVLSAIRVGP